MSRQTFLLRAMLMVQVGILLWSGVSIGGVSWMLEQSPQARAAGARWYVLCGVGASVLLTGVLVWRMQPVLRLLNAWDEDQQPDPALLPAAQTRAFSFPGQFLVLTALLVLVGNLVVLAIRTQRPEYPFTNLLLEIVFNATLALGLAFAVSVGLRQLLRVGVLRSIVLVHAWTASGSLAIQITLMAVLLSLVAIGLGSTLIVASTLHGLERAAAEEQARWLEQVVIPQALPMPVEDRMRYVAQMVGPDRVPFLLGEQGWLLSLVSMPSDFPSAAASQAGGLFLWRDDASARRALTVPFGPDRTLGLIYDSNALQSPVVMDTIRALGWLSLGELLLALLLGIVTGGDLASTLHVMSARLQSLAGEMPAGLPLIAQTAPDEVGELAVALNRTQQRMEAVVTLHQESKAALAAANEERQILQEAMQGLTAPVIRVEDGLVVVPLTGYFNDERAARIRPNLLSGIAAQRARMAVIDLTGVTEATDALIQYLSLAVHSAAMMGCQVILTGTRPNLAWSLTQQQTDLASVTALRNLEEGLAYAQARLRAS